MKLNPYTKAALAAVCLGIAVALFASAVQDVRKPCVGCEDEPETVIEQVAEASAELTHDDDD